MTDRSPALRICHLGKYYPPAPGGIESHVQTLAQAQSALGHEVRVICADHEPARRDSGGRRVAVREEMDGDVFVTRCDRRLSFRRLDVCPSLPGVLRSLAQEPPDLLHLHTPNPTMLLALAHVRPDVPLVITHHSDVIRQRVLKFVLRPFERLIYGRSARIQTTSLVYRFGSSFLARYADRVEALPLGADLTPFTNPSAEACAYADQLRAENPGPLWLCVGRLVYYKAIHVALRALAHVPGRLVVIGTGPLEQQLRAEAEEAGVADRVVWKGYVSREQLIGAYHAAKALWFPSNARSEAFGLVQVEAMASGCPVINANIPGSGVPWVSRHEESGLTVPIDDVAAFAAAARRLLDEPELHARVREQGRRRAETEFAHQTMARRSVEIYRRALNLGQTVDVEEVAEAPMSTPRAALDRPARTTAADAVGV